jgi:hypothetical protein
MQNSEAPQTKILSKIAQDALNEADARRKLRLEQEALRLEQEATREINGRGGLDPVRYGDWEKKGLAVDF